MRDERTSMFYWWPKVQDLPISKPRTQIVELTEQERLFADDGGRAPSLVVRVSNAINDNFKTPVFLRTDMTSGKHEWERTCYLPDSRLETVANHIAALVEFGQIVDIMGLPCSAIVIREYIPMMNLFTAFSGKMPVNPEMRFFVKSGRTVCGHWYWIEDAIEKPSIDNWKQILKEACSPAVPRMGTEFLPLWEQARMVSKRLEGYWSVDFCQAADGRWILIDMAEGERSWHPEDCKER